MAEEILKIKVSQLPSAATLGGLQILGVDTTNNRSVRASMSLLRGLDGKNVELRKTSSEIEWRVVGGTWATLVMLSDLKGGKGDKGDKGEQFRYSDFTPQQIADLKGDKGDKGDKGEQFRYSDFTPQQIADLKEPAIAAAGRVDKAIKDAEDAAQQAIAAANNWKKYW